MPSTAELRLASPYRALRPVLAGPDAPWQGMLVRLADGESGFLVDAADLPEGWRGWGAEATGHLVAPQDVVRRSRGHDVLLPAFMGRVGEHLERRQAGRVPLDAGEGVTLAVSVLRGLADLGEGEVYGEWWLTDAGQPVLATDRGDRTAVSESIRLLEQLTPSIGVGTVADLCETLERPRRHPSEVARLESLLFAIAEPTPIVRLSLAPRPARSFGIAQDAHTESSPLDGEQRPLLDRLVRHVDADLADLVSRATTGVWRRMRAPRRHSGRRPWMLAGLVAGGIVVAGILWPGGGPATADPATSSSPVSIDASPSPTVGGSTHEPTRAEGSEADLASIASALLTERSDCASDAICLAGVMVDAADVLGEGAIDLAADDRTTTLVDEFGGVAVLRVEPTRGGQPQLVVIQSDGHRWLLRDAYDAQQTDG